MRKLSFFLNYYKEDVDANRLKLFILKQLKDKSFEKKAEAYISEHRDRWVANLVDCPKGVVSIKDFALKESFEGRPNQIMDNSILVNEKTKQKFAKDIKETLNSLYSIYIKAKTVKKIKDKRMCEFVSFYEKTLPLFLKKHNLSLIDYYHQNINQLNDENKKCIGNIEIISNKKLEDGLISEVFFPEIRYKNFIIQKAKITVIKNN